MRLTRIFFRKSHHLTNLNDNLGEREAALLLRHDLGGHPDSKRLYECEQILFVRHGKRDRWPQRRNR
jgi:hypothetical protein